MSEEDTPEEYGTEQTEQQQYDPFDGGPGTQIATLITMMRIYDALMVQISMADDEKAEALSKIHAQGRILASLPVYSGQDAYTE